jgi:hypothetical protein
MSGEEPCLLLPPRVKLRGSRGGVKAAGLLRGEPVLPPLPCCGKVDEMLEPRAKLRSCACPPVRALLNKRKNKCLWIIT